MNDKAEMLTPEQKQAQVNNFAQKLKALTVSEGVSDIHFIGGDTAWPVEYGRPVKSTVMVGNDEIVWWAEVFGAQSGGALELMRGTKGSLETMAVIGGEGNSRRLRMAFRRQDTGYGMTLRIVPEIAPRLTHPLFFDNPVPEKLRDLTLNTPSGLILVCGPTGSGKSTMLAALLAEVNDNQHKHIYTIEDPIEFVHKSNMSIITQREVRLHTDSFVQALRDSMRSRPNIILVGELLDLETIRVAVEAANKGHLVFATSHAASAEEAVSSLVSKFPGDEQNHISTSLSQALRAVCVQRLVPTTDKRLVPARELMLNSTAISSKIREMSFNSITQGLKPTEDMWSIEMELAALWARDQISEDTARANANSQSEITAQLEFAKKNKAEASKASYRVPRGDRSA